MMFRGNTTTCWAESEKGRFSEWVSPQAAAGGEEEAKRRDRGATRVLLRFWEHSEDGAPMRLDTEGVAPWRWW